ncbi:hypothetical protein lerEdw1_014222, partial [Lerista edwardsae]
MGRTTTVMQCGFLMMSFLTSGISALKCHDTSSFQHNGSWVRIPTELSMSSKNNTCSEGQNACVEAQVILRIGQTFLSVTHRGCAKKELIDGAASNFSGDPHFRVKSNVRYCFRDLCNKEMSTDVAWSPLNDTVPEESGLNQCDSGLMLDPKESLQEVTCRRGYSQCYNGHGIIQAGPFAMSVLIKACQRPDCVVPKNLTFGPIEIHQWGSCCLGSYCNRNKTASEIQNTTGHLKKVIVSVATAFTKSDSGNGKESIPPADEIGAGSPGPPFNRILTPPPRPFEWERFAVAEAV